MEETKNNFVKAYEEHVDALYRYTMFNVRDKESAKDIVQNTFTKTWNYIAMGGEIDNIKAFLYKTLKNLIIDYYRSKKSASLDTLMEDEYFDPPAPVEVSIEEHAESLLAFKLLDKIPAEYKEVIMLRCVEGLSFKEIAHVLSEAENTVAVRFHRALKKVKELFHRKNAYNIND
ncbi:MAG: RNA polymerase sigma factor [Patescibacteria group bacterium]